MMRTAISKMMNLLPLNLSNTLRKLSTSCPEFRVTTMSDDPRSMPYDTAKNLETTNDIAEFLEVVVENYDERAFVSALQSAIRAAKRIMPVEMAGFSDNPDAPSLNRLVSLMQVLGFEFAFRPKRAA